MSVAETNTRGLRVLLDLWQSSKDTRQGRPGPGHYLDTWLWDECQQIANTPVGTGLNEKLASSAFKIGTLVQPGGLPYDAAFEALYHAALQAGANDQPKDRGVIDRQLREGMKKPRDLSKIGDGQHRLNGQVPPRPNADTSDDPLDQDATAADLIEANVTIRWGWDKWLPSGVLSVLASEPGIGKTRFCADLTRRVYLGLPWPDGAAPTFPKGSKTLWVPADNQHAELGTLPQAFGFPPEVLYLNATKRNPFAGTLLDALEDLRDFEMRIRRVQPALVFVDTSLNATDRSAHKPEDAKAFFVPLQQIAARCGVVMLCVTHLNAAGKPLGRRIMGQARLVMQLELPDPDQQDRRKLYVVKSNSLYPAPLGITMGSGGNEYDSTPPQAPEQYQGSRKAVDTPQLDACKDWLSDWLSDGQKKVGQTRTEAESKGFPAGTLYRAKANLGVEEFMVEGKKWWRFTTKDNNV